ncbi:unnamed protein product, partial [Ectocarpus sp. 8 AP-2014]
PSLTPSRDAASSASPESSPSSPSSSDSLALSLRAVGAGSGAQPGANTPPAGRLSLFGLPCVCKKGWGDGDGTTKPAFGERRKRLPPANLHFRIL